MSENKDQKNRRKKFPQNLKNLIKRCRKYENIDDYVYKLSCDVSSKKDKSRKWLIVMEKLDDTITNEKQR